MASCQAVRLAQFDQTVADWEDMGVQMRRSEVRVRTVLGESGPLLKTLVSCSIMLRNQAYLVIAELVACGSQLNAAMCLDMVHIRNPGFVHTELVSVA